MRIFPFVPLRHLRAHGLEAREHTLGRRVFCLRPLGVSLFAKFKCPECDREWVDDVPPPELDDIWPTCCETRADVLEPLEIDLAWLDSLRASVQDRYEQPGMLALMGLLEEHVEGAES